MCCNCAKNLGRIYMRSVVAQIANDANKRKVNAEEQRRRAEEEKKRKAEKEKSKAEEEKGKAEEKSKARPKGWRRPAFVRL